MKDLQWLPIVTIICAIFSSLHGASVLAVVSAPAIYSDITSNQTIDLNQWNGIDCLRNCDLDKSPRICYFKFVMEFYHAMGPACKRCRDGVLEDCLSSSCIPADGFEKGVMSINREIPGPAIQVCKNDLIVVDIANRMEGTTSTIHWHGLHQRNTPHMDGVPFVTQCPIDFSTKFRYEFTATEAGTQFYHSHTGHHKVNGHYGALIIRDRSVNCEHSKLYHFDEHIILASDWMHQMGEMYMPGLPSAGGILPSSLLINGHGRYFDPMKNTTTNTPLEIFYVQTGFSYRFRFINSASHICPLQLQIENHSFQIIASDSSDVKPIIVDTLISTAGERYDFVLVANKKQADYWIRLRALGSCDDLRIEQFAILSYIQPTTPTKRDKAVMPLQPAPKFDSSFPSGVYLNHPNTTCFINGDSENCICDLEAYQSDIEVEQNPADHRFVLSFNNYVLDNDVIFKDDNWIHFINVGNDINLVGAINNISLMWPSFPLLTQTEEIDESMFCSSGNKPARCAGSNQCLCTHRLKVDYNSIVELVIVDESLETNDINHPFHLHGFLFTVMDMGQHPLGLPMTKEYAIGMNTQRAIDLNQHKPPRKDTVSIPSKGYVVIRFRANNYGFWLLHCHFEWHLAVGMGLILQVGEFNQMVKPPAAFPKCNNYLPDVQSF